MDEFYLGAAAGAALCLMAGYICGKRIAEKREREARLKVSRALVRARSLIDSLNHQIALISDHSREYFHTLVLADFPLLQEISETLDYVMRVADQSVVDGDLAVALAIGLWVQNPDQMPAPVHPSIVKEQRDIIAGWRPRSRELLAQVTEALERAHAENVDSGIQRRRRDRRPTQVDLKKLRDSLTLG